jgi:hypothetical protein
MLALERVRQWARTLIWDIVVLSLAARDPRVPWDACDSPLASLDDLLPVPLGIWVAIRRTPPPCLKNTEKPPRRDTSRTRCVG